MFPLELDGKTRWPASKVNYVFQKMRAEVVDELRLRDMDHGIPEDGKVYSDTVDANGGRNFRINWALAEKKHDGAETNHLLQLKWDEFCSEPRDSSAVVIDRPKRVTKKQRLDEERKRLVEQANEDARADRPGTLSLEGGPARGRRRKVSVGG